MVPMYIKECAGLMTKAQEENFVCLSLRDTASRKPKTPYGVRCAKECAYAYAATCAVDEK